MCDLLFIPKKVSSKSILCICLQFKSKNSNNTRSTNTSWISEYIWNRSYLNLNNLKSTLSWQIHSLVILYLNGPYEEKKKSKNFHPLNSGQKMQIERVSENTTIRAIGISLMEQNVDNPRVERVKRWFIAMWRNPAP